MARRLAALLAPLLLVAAVSAGGAHAESCRTYVSKGLIQPAVGSLQDVIVVQDAYLVSSAAVSLDLSHRRIGALKITLGAQPFASDGSTVRNHPQITLKSQGLGRRGDNMYRTTFSDAAATAFPVNASFAPFTGSFRPVQKLGFLTDGDQPVAGAGGSQGLWTLTIADVAPNNTLRDIALNGWTLVLCPRGAAAPDGDLSAPSPSPSPVPGPPVKDFSGPPDVTVTARPPPAARATPSPTTVGGWTVVMKPTPSGSLQVPPAASPPGAPPADAPGAAGQPLQQLLSQGPVLTLLEQQITAIVSGMGGNCDQACLQAKRNLWAAAAFGLYVAHKHHSDPSHTALLDRLPNLLPGDRKPLHDLFTWMDEHRGNLKGLSDFMRNSMKLPTLSVNGQPLTLGSGKDGMKQLMNLMANGGTDSLQKLMGAFAAAGDRLQQLGSGLASNAGDSLQKLMSSLGNIGSGQGLGGGKLLSNLGNMQPGPGATALSNLLAATTGKAAAVADKKQTRVGDAAAAVDARLTGLNSFLDGLKGGSVDEVTAASLAEMSDSIKSLFDFSSFY